MALNSKIGCILIANVAVQLHPISICDVNTLFAILLLTSLLILVRAIYGSGTTESNNYSIKFLYVV